MTLTEMSVSFKRFSAWFIILVISFYLLKSGFFQAKKLYLTLNPPKIPPPEASFGKLPSLKFNSIQIDPASGSAFVLDTKTGTLPKLPDRIKIYKMVLPYPKIWAEKEAKVVASRLGFYWLPTKKSLVDFYWRDETNKKTLSINISTNDIQLETDKDVVIKNTSYGAVPSDFEAKTRATTTLNQLGLLNESISSADIKTFYTRLDESGFREAISFLQANLIRTDFYEKIVETGQKPEEGKLIFGPNPSEAFVSVYSANTINKEGNRNNDTGSPFLYYHYQTILKNEASAYPLLSIATVWDKVKNGGGNLVYLKTLNEDKYSSQTTFNVEKFEVRDVKLQYFKPAEPTLYLRPIYVFEGIFTTPQKDSGKFVIYHDALDPSKIQLQ